MSTTTATPIVSRTVVVSLTLAAVGAALAYDTGTVLGYAAGVALAFIAGALHLHMVRGIAEDHTRGQAIGAGLALTALVAIGVAFSAWAALPGVVVALIGGLNTLVATRVKA